MSLLTTTTLEEPSHSLTGHKEKEKVKVEIKAKASPAARRHISNLPITLGNWWQHVNWLNTTVTVIIPAYGLVAAYYTPLKPATLIASVLYYFITGLGITAGYHRLWAHRSYDATLPLQVYLALVGAGAAQNSIRRWARDHRSHHRYTDTDKDPYSVRKGLLYSHMGWLIWNQDPKRLGRTDISDLNQDPVVVWQHKWYVPIALFMGFIFPMLVCGALWGDWMGGFVYAGILRILVVQQATFCVNSLAHWLGEQPFDDRNSPKDHFFTALLTLGEGYHNFHHEFPSDYRNAIEWHQYDPTKWLIWVSKKLGLATDLKKFRQNEIEKGRLQQEQKALNVRKQRCVMVEQAEDEVACQRILPLELLPIMGWQEFKARTAKGEGLLVIAGVVHDVGEFMKVHPGGRMMIESKLGTDVTASFNGGVYNHSSIARDVLTHLQVGILRGGCEVEIWKSDHQD